MPTPRFPSEPEAASQAPAIAVPTADPAGRATPAEAAAEDDAIEYAIEAIVKALRSGRFDCRGVRALRDQLTAIAKDAPRARAENAAPARMPRVARIASRKQRTA